MDEHNRDIIGKAYQSFNNRDIDHILSVVHPDVSWPRALEGKYIQGHDEVRNYWIKQWQEINPNVKPLSLKENSRGQIEAMVHQVVKDLQGNIYPTALLNTFILFRKALLNEWRSKNLNRHNYCKSIIIFFIYT